MYSRYDPTAHSPFIQIDDAHTEQAPIPDLPPPVVETQPASAPASPEPQSAGLLDGIRGLLGGLKLGGGKSMDIGDLLLLAIIALLVLESGDQTDLIIVLAVALIIGF